MLVGRENPHGGDIYGRAVRLDFSANTNPLGTPPGVKAALIAAADRRQLIRILTAARCVGQLAATSR